LVHPSLLGEADVAAMMDDETREPDQQIHEVYWAEPEDQEIPPAAAASQAVNAAINGRRSSVTVTAAQAASDRRSTVSTPVTTGQETERSFWNVGGGHVPSSAPPLSARWQRLVNGSARIGSDRRSCPSRYLENALTMRYSA
jgi:hypothetical protein